MAVGSVNYAMPVQVNGYSCKNCSDVELATKHIDPVHPKSGPDNVDAGKDPTRNVADPAKIAAARRAADDAAADIVGYSRAGALTAGLAPGSGFSLAA